jgi:Recombinase
VWAALHRPIYRGDLVYAQTAKRDKWGQKRQAARPESEWIHVPAPALAIVTPDQWDAAHSRINAARAIYMKATNGHTFGRPALGNPSKYLLTNLASCCACCGPLAAQTGHHGHGRSRRLTPSMSCVPYSAATSTNRRRPDVSIDSLPTSSASACS